MSTRRSLFVLGALLAVGVLLAPAAAFAQLDQTQNDPTNVMAVAISTTEVRVTWDAPAENTAHVAIYEVGYQLAPVGTTVTWEDQLNITTTGGGVMQVAPNVSMSSQMYTVPGLTPGTRYAFNVRAVNGDRTVVTDWGGEAVASTLAAPVTPATLAAPTNVIAKPGDKEVRVSWTAVPGATGYKVEWRTESRGWGSAQEEIVSGGNTDWEDITSLTNGMEYTFRVRTGNAGGYGMPSDTVTATPVDPTVGGDGPFVTDVTVTPQLRNEIKVKWKYDESATNSATSQRFDVGWTDADGERFTAILAPQTIVAAPGGRVAREHVLKGLKVNQKYLIAVRAVHATATGTVITPVTADWRYPVAREMTPAGVSMVQNVQVEAGNGRLMVTWDAVKTVGDCMHAPAGSNACGYRVEWRAANQSYDDPQRQKDLKGVELATSYTIPGLMIGTEYHVVVSSYNERSTTRSPNSAEARQTPMAPAEGMLEAPNPVEAVAGDMEVTVKWTAVEDATGYRVQWRTASQSYDSSRQHDGFYAYRSGDLVLSHTVEDLENGMDYMFRVMAMGDGGMMSGPSDEVSAMPMMPTPALPVFGALVLGAGLVAAGRRRLRARRQRLVKA